MNNEDHFFDEWAPENIDRNTKRILDILLPDHIGYRGKSLFGKFLTKRNPTLRKQTVMRIEDKISLLLVYQGIRETTKFGFIFDDKELIKELCEKLSARGDVYLEISDFDSDMEVYRFSIAFTNQGYENETLKKLAHQKFSNDKMGKLLGYPEECVEEATKEDADSEFPSSFLDCTKKESKLLNSLILYTVCSEKQAESALEQAKERYDELKNLDSIYAEQRLEEFNSDIQVEQRDGTGLDKNSIEERRRKIKNSSVVTNLVDDLVVTENGEVVRKF